MKESQKHIYNAVSVYNLPFGSCQ